MTLDEIEEMYENQEKLSEDKINWIGVLGVWTQLPKIFAAVKAAKLLANDLKLIKSNDRTRWEDYLVHAVKDL